MSIPTLTNDERRIALEKAVAARARRAEVCAKLSQGELSVADVLAMAEDPEIGRMKVSTMIQALPKYGEAKSAKLMEELHIAESRRLHGLGARQRAALLERLS